MTQNIQTKYLDIPQKLEAQFNYMQNSCGVGFMFYLAYFDLHLQLMQHILFRQFHLLH